MATLLDNINIAREATIAIHYSAAVAELEEKAKNEPLKTKFHIYAGCVSEDVTTEIAHRFNQGGIKANVVKGGIFTTQWYITAETALPSHLVHEEAKVDQEVPVTEEVKVPENVVAPPA